MTINIFSGKREAVIAYCREIASSEQCFITLNSFLKYKHKKKGVVVINAAIEVNTHSSKYRDYLIELFKAAENYASNTFYVYTDSLEILNKLVEVAPEYSIECQHIELLQHVTKGKVIKIKRSIEELKYDLNQNKEVRGY
jgi:hypothetical protein